jgi:2-C-methyl-D-erythritol 4-phosphate cytidylyltransferase/2-C-methyl-D-erythritol 2,4-cyclodiphosphate synthase
MNRKIKVAAIIVSAGKGIRAGSDIPKQYHKVNNREIIHTTLEKFLNHPKIDFVLPIIAEQNEDLFKKVAYNLDIKTYCFGGAVRQESVYNGLKYLADNINPDFVLIHDAARPFTSKHLILEVIESLNIGNNAVIPVVKVPDTLKKCSDNKIENTISRESTFLAQTPQGFNFKKILFLHEKYKDQNFSDDSLLFEKEGLEISTVEGEGSNYKITTKEDLDRLKKNMSKEKEVRVGQGYDVHAFEEGEFLTICGTRIPYNKSLKGHSDADVGWHALVDAILGALGMGDIGEHFSDKDPKWKGADSAEFLKFTAKQIKEKFGILNNADITLICEAPKMKDYKRAMRDKTAEILEVSSEKINIKATTTEKMGFTGRSEGIAALASVSITLPKNPY